MTGKIINITDKLSRQPKFIAIDEKNYKVDCSKNAVLKFMDLNKRLEAGEIGDIECIEEATKLFLGADKYRELETENEDLSFDDWKVIFFACISAAMNRDLEEIENSFRNASKGE